MSKTTNWTPEQANAIYARGGSILVSAAAGSGKTAVLVNRVMERIFDCENPIDADKLLVVTFSNAAAAEMKHRIAKEISKKIKTEKNNPHLMRQQILLSNAKISTIHSFCLDLIRENFDKLSISADFKVADNKELTLLELDVIKEVTEQYYQQDNTGAFFELVELFSSGRDDASFIQTILKLYQFIRSHPFYHKWLDDKLAFYKTQTDVAQSIWGEIIFSYTQGIVNYYQKSYLRCIEIILEDEALSTAYLKQFKNDLSHLDALKNALKEKDWDKCYHTIRAFDFLRLTSYKGDKESSKFTYIKQVRENLKEMIKEKLPLKQFCCTSEEFTQDLSYLVEKIALLFEVTKTFDAQLFAEKTQRKIVDFTDLEQLALSLLVEEKDGAYQPTAIASVLSHSFEEILIDEFQDTNQVQDLIFRAISKQETNLFMVGDVKQSIYRFRQAMPEIFIAKKESFHTFDGKNFPATIHLGKNFRSREGVTSTINFIFEMLLSKEMGEITYDEQEKLIASATFTPNEQAITTIDFIDVSNETQLKDAVIEANYVAQKINSLINEQYLVQGTDGLRPIAFGDIAILLRSPKKNAECYLKELLSAGIDATSTVKTSFLNRREVSCVISFLKAINNPLSDIDLVASMLSPLFCFTADEIAIIRLKNTKQSFYIALTTFCSDNPNDEKACAFLTVLQQLRYFSTGNSTERLIAQLYKSTDFLNLTHAMKNGAMRYKNLLLLGEYAQKFESGGRQGLNAFVRFVVKLQENKQDFESASPSTQLENTVKIMSIHSSKGLEFPVVFICDTSKKFNKQDIRSKTILHSQLGFACKRRNNALSKEFTTIPLEALKLETEKSMLSEELRILYVALTRAKERIFITGTIKNPEKKLALRSTELIASKIPPFFVRQADSYADWIMMSALHHLDGTDLRIPIASELDCIFDGSRMSIHLVKPNFMENHIEDWRPIYLSSTEESLKATIEHQVDFIYPHLAATKIPTKLGISSIVKGQTNLEFRFTKKPKFLMEKEMSGADRGNLLHKFMQFANYSNAKLDIVSEANRLLGAKFFTQKEYESLELQKLTAFFESDTAKLIFDSPIIKREMKFYTQAGRDIIGDYFPDIGEHTIVLQGIADCVLIDDKNAIIIDYKSDYVKSEEELLARYRPQLDFYRKILSSSLKLTVTKCIIYSFCLQKSIVL